MGYRQKLAVSHIAVYRVFRADEMFVFAFVQNFG